jgi:hypothetical protein
MLHPLEHNYVCEDCEHADISMPISNLYEGDSNNNFRIDMDELSYLWFS